MNVALLKALGGLIPTGLLLCGSAVLFHREKTAGSFLQLFGATSLVVVILTHLAEALHLLPWMHWGDPHSAGHYLDLGSALLALVLFPTGYALDAVRRR